MLVQYSVDFLQSVLIRSFLLIAQTSRSYLDILAAKAWKRCDADTCLSITDIVQTKLDIDTLMMMSGEHDTCHEHKISALSDKDSSRLNKQVDFSLDISRSVLYSSL